MDLTLHNTLSNKEEKIIPRKQDSISMYVCGPTVYERPHIGNIRSAVFYDLLFRILKSVYTNVTYVRNITDVDDKIINTAKAKGVSCEELCNNVIELFNSDMKLLNCLTPTHQPKATKYIDEIISPNSKTYTKRFCL